MYMMISKWSPRRSALVALSITIARETAALSPLCSAPSYLSTSHSAGGNYYPEHTSYNSLQPYHKRTLLHPSTHGAPLEERKRFLTCKTRAAGKMMPLALTGTKVVPSKVSWTVLTHRPGSNHALSYVWHKMSCTRRLQVALNTKEYDRILIKK
jgi:hypothetical protein